MQKGSRLLRALHGLFKKDVAVSGFLGPQTNVDQALTTLAGRFNAFKTHTRKFRVNPEYEIMLAYYRKHDFIRLQSGYEIISSWEL